MKLALILLTLLPVILAMTIPQNQDEIQDAHEDAVNWIRLHSIGEPDEAVGEKLHNWSPNDGRNPEELGSYFEGDILTIEPLIQPRNGIIDTYFRWPNAIIYYQIQKEFNADQTSMIIEAMNHIKSSTCIKFIEYDGTQTDYVSIQSTNTGCWSTLGRIGGPQQLNLQIPACTMEVRTAIHELLHTIGFYHEQSKMNRDDYVDIFWENINNDETSNFLKVESDSFGMPYDYNSIMHYSEWMFSKNGKPTMKAKNGAVIGQAKGLSASDIIKINRMYNCNNRA